MRNTSNQGSTLVALIPNVVSHAGFQILEAARSLDERRIGNCLVIEASFDALTLIDIALDFGAEKILLMAGVEREDLPSGISFLGSYPPSGSPPRDPQVIVKRLWPNLTGSLDIESYVDALSILSPIPFDAYVCNTLGLREGKGCAGLVREWIESVCGESDRPG